MSSGLLTLTLSLISAVESNVGTILAHKVVRNPASIHFGDAAVGTYGMMPNTLKALHEANPDRAAPKLAKRILARNTANIRGYLAPSSPCPFITAVVLWKQGPNATIHAYTWNRPS